jgi:thioredoxin 1
MADKAKYVQLTDSTFQEEVLNADQPVLVDFWAVWCGPCRRIAPMIEELAEEFEGRAKVAKLDVDHNPETAMAYGIRSIPTLLFFKDGRPVDHLVGVSSKRELSQKLEALVAQPV